MKNSIKTFFLVLFACFSLEAQNENILPQFRDFEWNSSPDKIKKEESARYLQTFSGFGAYAISYRGDFLGLNSRIDFTFKDSMLVEGSYQINADLEYKNDFRKIRDHFTEQYGKPKYWAIKSFDSEHIWIRETDFGTFRGPELFWEFDNGFIAIQSSRYIEEITITVLYVYGQKINEYGSADVFNFEY